MSGEVWAVIAAAGNGERMGGGKNKLLFDLCGLPVIVRALMAFERAASVDKIAISCAERDEKELKAIVEKHGIGKVALFVRGGDSRQISVFNALRAIKKSGSSAELALIHDGARPFVSTSDINRCADTARIRGACVLGRKITDTVKEVSDNERDEIAKTHDRERLFAAQTPQAFLFDDIYNYHQRAEKEGFFATDDAALAERYGEAVLLLQAENSNMKLTTREDYLLAQAMLINETGPARTGVGYDIHKLAEGRPLILCGVKIPHEKGLLGHSDADVAVHALIDAILGAAALGDIGQHFPDSDAAYKGISSILLLKKTMEIIKSESFKLINCDLTITCQRPKLLPHKDAMRGSLAKAMACDISMVSVKAKTTEGLGFEGREEGISCYAIATLAEKGKDGGE
ncbi:MAG: 2-C-methyl-D-erythritol 2,4-cyclodiphosphate synthase [Christensenellales bacterium]|jgi:2-C-methyl-D-erythritol 4-phosphate cytidylyltransferase/2-C-methyl-D-erythritol 2,4-cyclodiphosphate synthase